MVTFTPEKLAASGTEDGTQRAYLQAVRMYLSEDFPETSLIYHVPNGGQRGDARSAMITGGKLKAIGQQSGVPDIVFPVAAAGFSSLYIEFKKPDGRNGLEPEQLTYILDLASRGALVVISKDWKEAYTLTAMYLNNEREELIKSSTLIEPCPQLAASDAKIGRYAHHQRVIIDSSGFMRKLITKKARAPRKK